jgi:hypothetical protein
MTPSAYRAQDHGAVQAMPTCEAKARTRPTRHQTIRPIRIEEATPAPAV